MKRELGLLAAAFSMLSVTSGQAKTLDVIYRGVTDPGSSFNVFYPGQDVGGQTFSAEFVFDLSVDPDRYLSIVDGSETIVGGSLFGTETPLISSDLIIGSNVYYVPTGVADSYTTSSKKRSTEFYDNAYIGFYVLYYGIGMDNVDVPADFNKSFNVHGHGEGYLQFYSVFPDQPADNIGFDVLEESVKVEGVPEPSVWFTTLLGLGIAGSQIRRKRFLRNVEALGDGGRRVATVFAA